MPDRHGTVPPDASSGRATRTTIAVAYLVAIAAFESVGFRLSYDSLHAIAVANEVDPGHAWMFPVLVDGGIVLGSIGVVRSIAADRTTTWPWIVTAAFTLISWSFNVANAPSTLGGWAVATVPPLAQMVALELGMQELRALLLPASTNTSATRSAASSSFVPSASGSMLAKEPPASSAEEPPVEEPPVDSSTEEPPVEEPPVDSSTEEPPVDSSTEEPPVDSGAEEPPNPSWAEQYRACSSEEARIALTRLALVTRPDLKAPAWAADIALGETRARDLLRAARAPRKVMAPADS
ncbi:DUF2637 domain-containing protein [Streptomyces sp. NPDC056465]|uniref:DUF2637 domain-containing protein n=1 Tax=Streptomyces sp. NPDC056465 TaxID=3345829 RepID=UPI0036837D13